MADCSNCMLCKTIEFIDNIGGSIIVNMRNGYLDIPDDMKEIMTMNIYQMLRNLVLEALRTSIPKGKKVPKSTGHFGNERLEMSWTHCKHHDNYTCVFKTTQ